MFVTFQGDRIIDLAFYEPSKALRKVARALRPGDRVRVWGSVRADGRSLNVEKIRIDELAIHRIRVANPICPTCGKAMKSVGRDHGFRCIHGHARAAASAAMRVDIPRAITLGWHEPPAFARRHLTKPISRILFGRKGPMEQELVARGVVEPPAAPSLRDPESAEYAPNS